MFKSILVPLDGSHASEAILPVVRRLVASTGASVHLVRAVADPVTAALAAYDNTILAVPAMVPAETRDGAVQEAAGYLREMARRLGEGADAHIFAAIGTAPAVILDAIPKTAADVVVMSTHGRTALGALVMGSVATAVVRQSPVPVMLLRPDRAMLDAAAASSEAAAAPEASAAGA